MREDRLRFIEALFDDDDRVAFGPDPKHCNKPADIIPFFLNTEEEQFCINPLDKWRDTDNITKIQSLLFEIDKDKNDKLVEEDIQEKLFLDSGIPFTTMVSSGNKSIHVILRFTEPFESGAIQACWWNAIAKVLLKHNIVADVRARLLTQISRVPCSIRSKTGEMQTLKHIRNRVTPLEVTEWLELNGVVVEPVKPYIPYEWDPSIDRGDNLTKFNRAVSWTQKHKGVYSTYMSTGLHDWLFTYGGNCFKNQLDVSTAIGMAVAEYGTQYTGSSGTGYVEKAVELGWKWMEKKN